MFVRRVGLLLGGCLLVASCSSTVQSSVDDAPAPSTTVTTVITTSTPATAPAPTTPPSTTAATTAPSTTPDTSVTASAAPTSTAPSTTTTVAPTTSTVPPTSTTAAPTTTTTVPPLDVHDPLCVIAIAPGDSLGAIADRYDDETIDVTTLRAENDIIGDLIHPGDLLDICVGNSLDDITGEQRTNRAIAEAAVRDQVELQQLKLNELFAGLGTPELLVDGISGPVTRQRLCAARVALDLPVNRGDMEPGSAEEQTLMAATTLPMPFTSALNSERWILIDRTCQIMFVGTGSQQLNFVFPTSTGSEGFETRDQDRSRAFRFDPALDNGGWHDSTDYPVAIDNPRNGNMYKPLYFDGGQAIHGANNVPTSPQSKGCARLRVGHQDLLLGWLGLADRDGPTNSSDRINVTVNVQGAYAAG